MKVSCQSQVLSCDYRTIGKGGGALKFTLSLTDCNNLTPVIVIKLHINSVLCCVLPHRSSHHSNNFFFSGQSLIEDMPHSYVEIIAWMPHY